MEESPVHANAIRTIVNDSGTSWSDRLNRIIDYKRKHLGLKGCRVSFFPDGEFVLDAEKMAHDICMMELAYIEGKYEEVTGEEL